MKFSIIINTKNQRKFLKRAVNSCLIQTYNNYEIIVVELNNKSNSTKIKYLKNKKIVYINLIEKFSNPTQNQLYAIKKGVTISKGQFILLLDGDDYFNKDKIKYLNYKINKEKKNLFMDCPIEFSEKKKEEKKKIEIKIYKRLLIYKFLINNWPSISCTSGITVKKEIIDNFYKKTKPFRWKNLAIDIQLAIFYTITDKIFFFKKNLTFKSLNNKNLDKRYTKFFSKKYWYRRYEQHIFYYSFEKNFKYFKGIDFYFCKIVSFILNLKIS